MHMADALLSPSVGTAMWGVTVGAITFCSAKLKSGMDDRKVPLMGVLGAFLFAAQMINFTIPATGSSGHLGGGLLLAALLGPHAAFLTIASVLMVQALFFADGGLLALGCNIFNLGIIPAFVAYPLIYRPLAGRMTSSAQSTAAAILAALTSLQLGAFCVVLETSLSGISSLPFTTFASLMQPVHLAIGLVEGVVTAVIITFVHKARPDIFTADASSRGSLLSSIVPAFLALALITGGFISWFASEKPDGLEWSIKQATGREELEAPKEAVHGRLAAIQDKVSFMPDYDFKKAAGSKEEKSRLGTSLAGLIGALITLLVTGAAAFMLRMKQQLAARKPHTYEHSHPHVHEHDHPHSHGELLHSHSHSHEHSHPHPHLHDHSDPHKADPDPHHSHEAKMAEHSHRHDDPDHGSHEHHHDQPMKEVRDEADH